jgi:hypothetical protein
VTAKRQSTNADRNDMQLSIPFRRNLYQSLHTSMIWSKK